MNASFATSINSTFCISFNYNIEAFDWLLKQISLKMKNISLNNRLNGLFLSTNIHLHCNAIDALSNKANKSEKSIRESFSIANKHSM